MKRVALDETSTTTTTTTTTGPSRTPGGVVVASAMGGAAVSGAAAIAVAKKAGLSLPGFGGSSATGTSMAQDVNNIEAPHEREQFQPVTGDLFS